MYRHNGAPRPEQSTITCPAEKPIAITRLVRSTRHTALRLAALACAATSLECTTSRQRSVVEGHDCIAMFCLHASLQGILRKRMAYEDFFGLFFDALCSKIDFIGAVGVCKVSVIDLDSEAIFST